MSELDALFHDLEAGLFLQGGSPRSAAKQARPDTHLGSGLLSITCDRRRFDPEQALIGRDFVAWADAREMCIVPGRFASIRVEKDQLVPNEAVPRLVIRPKLTMAKYLGRLTGQAVQLKMSHAQNLTGALVGVKGSFALIELVAATALVEITSIIQVTLPVHNFSESCEEGLR